MDPLALVDGICILKHEAAYTAPGESPVSVCAGDESVASHFALITAYEDIKKTLRDTERENTLLRKRVKQLEEKLFKPDAPPSEGPQYLNKLLQLRTEMDITQVMRSMNSIHDYWQVDLAWRNPMTLTDQIYDQSSDAYYNTRERSMQQSYKALCCEAHPLYAELKLQLVLIKILKPSVTERWQVTVHNLSSNMLPDSLKEDCWYNGPWPSQSYSADSDNCSGPYKLTVPNITQHDDLIKRNFHYYDIRPEISKFL
uniref:Uncharacterized protein n=1 Tax=Gouania willdenowi TaxID=441366 RepID=A0A8C5E1N0_GOUWI